MKISLKTPYGLSALAALARHPSGCSVHALAQKEHLPEDYLEKILQHLKQSGFVVSQKGIRGGYALAKSPRAITSWDILWTLDGSFKKTPRPAFSGTLSPCPVLTHCQTKSVWEHLESAMKNTLSRVTLADLVPQEPCSEQHR